MLMTAERRSFCTDSRPRLQRGAYLGGIAYFLPVAAQHLGEFAERHVAQEIADIAALLAVLRELAVADLVHRRIVADDREIRHAEAIGGFHVEGGHAEGAVAVIAQDFLGRIRKSGGNRKTGAHTE